MSEIDTSTEAIAEMSRKLRSQDPADLPWRMEVADMHVTLSAERDALRAEVKRLREALAVAANRLQRRAVDFDAGSHEFIETSEWAADASATLKGAANG